MKVALGVLLAFVAGSVQSFHVLHVPSNKRSSARKLAPHLTFTDTLQKTPEVLTTEDEEILFGGDGTGFTSPLFTRGDSNNNGKQSQPNPLDVAKDPLINRLRTMRLTMPACPLLWMELERLCPDNRALLDEHLCDETIDVTFAQMSRLVRKSASVFADLGVDKGVHVAMLAENSARWLMVDHGIQLAGGVSAVRGADAPLDELRYIYEHSDSAGIVVLQGPCLLKKFVKDSKEKNLPALGLSNSKYGKVKTVILLNREKKSDEDIANMAADIVDGGVQVKLFADLLNTAPPIPAHSRPQLSRDDLSTIVYTSGTTGRPKGVMLSHGNLMHQTGHRLAPTRPVEESEPLPGETTVVLLPVWHITERMFELWMATRGCNIVYSSIRTFKNDLAKYKPQWMVLVPRVLEKIAAGVQDKFSSGSVAVKALSNFFTATGNLASTHRRRAKGLVVADVPLSNWQRLSSNLIVTALTPINAVGDKLVWSKVRDGFGGRVKLIISGGSALAGGLETFYETAGLNICVGYGLTECSPLITHRLTDANLVAAGCAGRACANTELRIVDPETKSVKGSPRPSLPRGQAGVVVARGPQVMQGYYKNPEATAKAIDEFGFFDTGDLGRINPATGDLILTGRAKDTIVLSNGENVEPTPIEDAILGESPLVEQVMLTGQDGRHLVAIAVLKPNELGVAGYLPKAQAEALQTANEKVSNPKCSLEDCEEGLRLLNEAAKELRNNNALKSELVASVSRATKGFRKWEQVSSVYLTLEPFAMCNGQLTQSYKVKRAEVLERYQESLPK